MQYTTLCLPKSKLTFKMKLRCSFFSRSVISFSDYRSVTPKSLYHFSVSQRLVCKLFPLAYNIVPYLWDFLVSYLQTTLCTCSLQSCHVFSAFVLCTCSSFCQTWPALFSAGKILAYPLRSTSNSISSEISLTSARGSTVPQSTLTINILNVVL